MRFSTGTSFIAALAALLLAGPVLAGTQPPIPRKKPVQARPLLALPVPQLVAPRLDEDALAPTADKTIVAPAADNADRGGLRVKPRLLFDAQRASLPASWWQVDPQGGLPLMRQSAGVESEYVRRSLGLELAYGGDEQKAPSRFSLDVGTNDLDQDTVRATVGIPLQ